MLKYTNIIDLEKYDYVSSFMTIEPILEIDREKMGAMRILKVINYGVYVCICRVYSDVFKDIYHMNFSMTVIFHN